MMVSGHNAFNKFTYFNYRSAYSEVPSGPHPKSPSLSGAPPQDTNPHPPAYPPFRGLLSLTLDGASTSFDDDNRKKG